jgi:Mn2+/Fe2+ NRAMP family transporter
MSSFEKLNTKRNYNIMKKIIALSALLTLGIGFTATAQQKKATLTTAPAQKAALPANAAEIIKAADKNVATLNSVVTLTAEEKQMFQGLFKTKYKNLNRIAAAGNDAAEKESTYKAIEMKLRATLSPDKMAKLDAKPAILKELTH